VSPKSSACPLAEALRLMTLALQILDSQKSPGDIGAHLDLAVQRLRETLASGWTTGPHPH
jgi:hypothetical protein